MRREPSRFRWRTGALVLALLLVLWLVGSGSRDSRRVVLADGSTLTLRSVSFGTNHCAPPAFWNRLLHRVPSVWGAKLGLTPPQMFTTTVPWLVTWWERSADGLPTLFLQDDEGVLGEPGAIISLVGARGPFAAAWKRFPRRVETLRFCVYADSARGEFGPVAELRVKNPARGTFPFWTSEPLPLPKRIDDLEFSLVDFEIEVARGKHGYHWLDAPQPWAILAFHITSGGQKDPGWRTAGFVLSDATGNAVTLPGETRHGFDRFTDPQLPRREAAGTHHAVSFLWPLWLDEPAYRLRVEFARGPDAQFPIEDILEVKAVPVPPADGVSMINLRTNLHGFEIQLLALVGEHATLPGREHDVFGQTTLEVDVPPLPGDLRFDVVELRDDQGRRAEPMSGAGSLSQGFRIPDGAPTVDLKLAVSKRYVVEFLVKPDIRRVEGGRESAEPGGQ